MTEPSPSSHFWRSCACILAIIVHIIMIVALLHLAWERNRGGGGDTQEEPHPPSPSQRRAPSKNASSGGTSASTTSQQRTLRDTSAPAAPTKFRTRVPTLRKPTSEPSAVAPLELWRDKPAALTKLRQDKPTPTPRPTLTPTPTSTPTLPQPQPVQSAVAPLELWRDKSAAALTEPRRDKSAAALTETRQDRPSDESDSNVTLHRNRSREDHRWNRMKKRTRAESAEASASRSSRATYPARTGRLGSAITDAIIEERTTTRTTSGPIPPERRPQQEFYQSVVQAYGLGVGYSILAALNSHDCYCDEHELPSELFECELVINRDGTIASCTLIPPIGVDPALFNERYQRMLTYIKESIEAIKRFRPIPEILNMDRAPYRCAFIPLRDPLYNRNRPLRFQLVSSPPRW